MPKTLLVYLQNVPTTGRFDSTIIAASIGADIGYALAENGESLQDYYLAAMLDVLHGNPVPIKTSTAFHERFCITDDSLLTDQVRLGDGRIASVADYDVLLVCHVWFHNYYVAYLRRQFPTIKLIGVQEEAVQDVAAFSSFLQTLHLRCLRLFDGYIAVNREYERWVSPFVRNLIHISLPVPKDQFGSLTIQATSRRRDVACVGVGTWNLDASNFYTNILVLEGIRGCGVSIKGEIIGIRDWQRPQVGAYASNMEGITIAGELGEQLYSHLSRFKLAINLTSRATSGRIAAEFAAVGVPCIGNLENEHQSVCWPDLSIAPYDVPKAIELGTKLLGNSDFYDACVGKGRRKLTTLIAGQEIGRKLTSYIESVVPPAGAKTVRQFSE